MKSEAASKGSVVKCEHIAEQLLVFAGGGLHVDPKSGISRFGPRSYGLGRHPDAVRVGIIGTADTVDKARTWLEANADGIRGDEGHPAFPGFRHDRGFFSDLKFDDGWTAQITQSEMSDVLRRRPSRDKFSAAVDLLEDKLRFLSETDQPPQYVLVGLPNELLHNCSTVDYHEKGLGVVHRDLRRAFKAAAMKYRIPTQILRQPTMEGKDSDTPSKIAWNFFTGMYFKAGGIPWGPTGLPPGTCFVGISFYRSLGSGFASMQTSLVQAFDENGEGIVLRGHDVHWDPEKEGTRAPHLNEEQAVALIDTVLARYQQEMRQLPKRVVVHKTSQYWPAEREGFQNALRHRVDRYDLLSLQPQEDVRLITKSMYPPLQGTVFSVGVLDFLYTTGFVPELGEFHGMHVPSPIRISDHVGQDTSRVALLRELLMLTKMNWNSAHLGGLLPVTVRFARLVGDIMREIPADREPLPQFKFYV